MAILVALAVGYVYLRSLGWWLLPMALAAVTVIGLAFWRLQLRRQIRAKTLQEMLDLTPANFERAIGTLLSDIGYSDVKNIGRSGDQGIDLLCRDPNGRSCGVQCKRYAPGRTIGSPELRRFLGSLVYGGLDHGIYVTTSAFTTAAVEVAQHSDIGLIDGHRLTSLLLERQERLAADKVDAVSSPSTR
jgi:restriction system protein